MVMVVVMVVMVKMMVVMLMWWVRLWRITITCKDDRNFRNHLTNFSLWNLQLSKLTFFKGSPPLAADDEDDGATIMVVMLMTMMIMAKLLILMDCIAVRGNYK